jgi:hypothetical protein
MAVRTFLLAFAALLLLGVVARADVVYLKNGKSIEGKVTVKGDKVIVQIAHGSVSFPKDKVLRIERKVSAVETYDKKLAALPAKDVAARLKLAGWCRRRGLGNRSGKLLEEVLDLDSENATARELLGYVRHGGKWMKPEDKFRALGLVKFEGKWHKPESVAAIKQARAAAQEAESKRRQAEVELKIKQAELKKLQAERARLEAERRKADAERAKLDAERRRLERIFVRYPHFKAVGNTIYYYPDYPVCRKGVIFIRIRPKSTSIDEKKKDDAEKKKEEQSPKSSKTVSPAELPGSNSD